MKLVLFLTAEFIHMITAAFLIVILYLGGWHFPGITGSGTEIGWGMALLRIVVLLTKVVAVILFFMLVRWSWPRFRFDQLMALAWKVMLPLGVVNLLAVAVFSELQHPGRAGGGLSSLWVGLGGWLVAAVGWIVVAMCGPLVSDNRPRAGLQRSMRSMRRSDGERTTMKTDSQQIRWVESPQLGLLERMYLPLFIGGLTTTARHLVGTKVTVSYPDEEPQINNPLIYRGVHRLNRDAQGRVKCVACFLCATACPAHCIDIVGIESPWPDREKYPESFTIDELRCIYCGMCEEACPVDAIELTSLYNLTGRSREEMIFDKEKLLSVYDMTKDAEPHAVRSSGRGPTMMHGLEPLVAIVAGDISAGCAACCRPVCCWRCACICCCPRVGRPVRGGDCWRSSPVSSVWSVCGR